MVAPSRFNAKFKANSVKFGKNFFRPVTGESNLVLVVKEPKTKQCIIPGTEVKELFIRTEKSVSCKVAKEDDNAYFC